MKSTQILGAYAVSLLQLSRLQGRVQAAGVLHEGPKMQSQEKGTEMGVFGMVRQTKREPRELASAGGNHTEAQPAVVKLQASSFIQQPPSTSPLPGSLPRLLCKDTGVKLQTGEESLCTTEP